MLRNQALLDWLADVQPESFEEWSIAPPDEASIH